MASVDVLGTTSGVITVLEASIKVFGTIIQIAASLAQYSQTTLAIIRQCRFDAGTLETIISIIRSNPTLFRDDKDKQNAEEVFCELQISLFSIKSQLEPYQQKSLMSQLVWSLTFEKVATQLEEDLFRWSQRLSMRLSILFTQNQGLLTNSNSVSPIPGIPHLLSPSHMKKIVTQSESVQPNSLRRRPDEVSLSGTPSSRMLGSTSDGTRVLVEFRPYENPSTQKTRDAAEANALRLAAILSHAQPSLMNILQCAGVYHDEKYSRFGILFRAPPGTTPTTSVLSLSDLIERQPKCSLTKRFQIAHRIAIAVFVTHGVEWVHKTIQTRKVVLFARDDHDAGDAFLTGFEDARETHAVSIGLESNFWQERLYRHPDRQEESNNKYFVPEYDIYSLGVVLLEIARWSLLVKDKRSDGRYVFDVVGPKKSEAILKQRYLPHIGHFVGEAYARIVQDCLDVKIGQRKNLMSDVLSRLEQLAGTV